MTVPCGLTRWRAVRSSTQLEKADAAGFLDATGGGIAAPAQHAADAGQQFARLEWLGQVIVGAHFQPEDAVQRLAAGSQHDDRQGRVGAQLAAQGQAVFARQVQVQHDQVGLGVVEQLPHGRAVAGAMGAVTVGFQIILQQGADIAVVVNDEDSGGIFHAYNYPLQRWPRVDSLYRHV